MIRITKKNLCAELQKIAVREPLHGSGRADGHEVWRFENAVRSLQCATTSFCSFCLKDKRLCCHRSSEQSQFPRNKIQRVIFWNLVLVSWNLKNSRGVAGNRKCSGPAC